MTDTRFGYITPDNIALFTDLYELTMLQGYHETGHEPRAVFDLFVRDLPPHRGYLVAAGLEQAVHYLEHLTFTGDALDYLAEQGFHDAFLDRLADFEFTGDVRAVPEGTPVFPDEPIIEVEASIMEAQLLETMLINQVAVQSLVATKAARMREMVERHGTGQALVDFGSRRAHGTDAGVKAARAAIIGGFDATSNVAAGEAFDIPVSGTMAHSWIESFPSEREAFEAYVDVYGDDSVLLIDTYDTVNGAETARAVADGAGSIRGVRIDSGDLAALSREVADIVGDDIDVYVSSGLDEDAIRAFLQDDGVAAGFGVGTNLVTSADAPVLEAVYKLVAVEHDGEMAPVMKHSPGKATLPGPKAVHRVAEDGTAQRDVIGRRGESLPGRPLLEEVMVDGDVVAELPGLEALRDRARTGRRALPRAVRDIDDPDAYPVETSERLDRTRTGLREDV